MIAALTSEYFEYCRKRLGLTFTQVERRANISNTTVRKILEGGISNARVASIIAVADALDLELTIVASNSELTEAREKANAIVEEHLRSLKKQLEESCV